MTISELKNIVTPYNACQEALDWLDGFDTMEEAFAVCTHPDWMLWMLTILEYDIDSLCIDIASQLTEKEFTCYEEICQEIRPDMNCCEDEVNMKVCRIIMSDNLLIKAGNASSLLGGESSEFCDIIRKNITLKKSNIFTNIISAIKNIFTK